FAGLVESAAVEHGAPLQKQKTAKPFRIEPRDAGGQADFAEPVGLTLVDHKGEDKALDRGVVFSARLANAGVGIAMIEVVLPDLLAVGIDTIGIVDVAAGQEA